MADTDTTPRQGDKVQESVEPLSSTLGLQLDALVNETLSPEDMEVIRRLEAQEAADAAERVAGLTPSPTLTVSRQRSGEPRTDRQRLWAKRLENLEKLEAKAIEYAAAAAAHPGDPVKRRNAATARWAAKQYREAVERGRQTHGERYRQAHGDTPEDRRDGWRQAKREAREAATGQPSKHYKRRADMTETEWTEHKRKQSREKKAVQRAKKKLVSNH